MIHISELHGHDIWHSRASHSCRRTRNHLQLQSRQWQSIIFVLRARIYEQRPRADFVLASDVHPSDDDDDDHPVIMFGSPADTPLPPAYYWRCAALRRTRRLQHSAGLFATRVKRERSGRHGSSQVVTSSIDQGRECTLHTNCSWSHLACLIALQPAAACQCRSLQSASCHLPPSLLRLCNM